MIPLDFDKITNLRLNHSILLFYLNFTECLKIRKCSKIDIFFNLLKKMLFEIFFFIHLKIWLCFAISANVCITALDRKYYFESITNEYFGAYLVFRNFKVLNDLELNCSNKYMILEHTKNYSSLNLHFFPNNPLLITKSFTDFLLNAFQLNDLLQYSQAQIVLENIIGIENNLFIPNKNIPNPYLILMFSKFDFYNYNIKINSTDCNLLYGPATFFSQFNYIMLTKVKFPEFLCPNIFENSNVEKLTLNDITNSLLVKNR